MELRASAGVAHGLPYGNAKRRIVRARDHGAHPESTRAREYSVTG
jgi:hypothetical protein